MAENDQAQEKTEEPTQRRLEKAREDGDVLSSKEMFVFASSAAGLFVILVQVWEAQFCKKLVKDMTGAEAIEKYEECKKW